MKTDAQLEADVAAELRWEAGERASEIGLTVEGGVVALSGVVGTLAQRRAAAEAVERVVGVRAIRNRVVVRSGESGAGRTSARQRLLPALFETSRHGGDSA